MTDMAEWETTIGETCCEEMEREQVDMWPGRSHSPTWEWRTGINNEQRCQVREIYDHQKVFGDRAGYETDRRNENNAGNTRNRSPGGNGGLVKTL